MLKLLKCSKITPKIFINDNSYVKII